MPVPSKMADLSNTAALNSPPSTETVAPNLDNYLRSISAILKSTNSVASSTIAAASTVDIANADGEHVVITGAATINSLGTGFIGCVRELRFASAGAVIVHSADIVIPGAGNITVSAGDVYTARCTDVGVWMLVAGSRSISFNGTVTSVNLTSTTGLTASGGPITGSGSLTYTLSANLQGWHGIAPSAKQDALGYTPVNKAGDSMFGSLLFYGNPSRIKLYDNNLDVACLELGAGYTSDGDRNGFIFNGNAAGFISILARAGGAELRLGDGSNNAAFNCPVSAAGSVSAGGKLAVTSDGGDVLYIRKMTAAAYAALGTKNANTLYVIVG